MTEHEKVQEQLSLLVDSSVTDEEKASLLSHVENCPQCAELLEVYTEISRLMAAETVPPDELVPNVMEKIRRVKAERRRKTRRIGVCVAVAASLVLLMIPLTRFAPWRGAMSKNLGYSTSGGMASDNNEKGRSELSEYSLRESADAMLNDAAGASPEMDGTVDKDEPEPASAQIQGSETQDNADPNSVKSPESNGGDTSFYQKMYDTADELAADGFHALVYAEKFPEELERLDTRLVYCFSDGTEAALIDLSELETLEKAGYEIMTLDENATDALVVYRP